MDLIWSNERTVKRITVSMIPAMILLGLGALEDLKEGKIKNSLVGTGLIWGLLYRTWLAGGPGIIGFLTDILWPVALLFPLFLMRGLGAGDIKLFAAISPFLPGRTMGLVIIISFFLGAGISCYRILRYLFEKKILKNPKSNFDGKIRFGVCIFFGFLISILGEITA